MDHRVRLYLRVFAWTTIPFTLFITVVFFVLLIPVAGSAIGLPTYLGIIVGTGVGAGVLFGALMSALLVTLHLVAVNDSRHPGGIDVIQSKTIVLSAPISEAADLCCATLEQQVGARVVKTGGPPAVLIARTGLSWRTFGDEIRVVLAEEDLDQTRIEITSRPRSRTTLLDFGANQRNVDLVAIHLLAHGARRHKDG